jgi:hypothetical protein
MFELMITAGRFLIIWAVMWVVLIHGHWSGLLLVVPAADLVVSRTIGLAARSAL